MSKHDVFTLRLSSGRTLPLTAGVSLSAEDLLGIRATAADGAVAEVGRNPTDPTVLGLRNLSSQAWAATVSGGGQRRVEPGRNLRLAGGTTINLGTITGTIREEPGGFSLTLPSGLTTALQDGVRLSASNLLGMGGTSARGPVAEVERHPNDPAVLGLKNLSHQGWVASVAGGGQRRIDPGRSIRLAVGTTINFGNVTAAIEGQAVVHDPMETKPYFDAALANPPPRPNVNSVSTQGAQAGQFDWQTFRPYVLSTGIVGLYTLLTRSLTAPVVTLALVWALRQLGARFDAILSPLWSYRDLLPLALRSKLAWIAPITMGYILTLSPSFFNRLTWLPGLDPDASAFACTTVLAGLIAYFLIHEPQGEGTR